LLRGEDILDHTFMSYVAVREVSNHCFSEAGIQCDIPDGTENVEVWWFKARKR
jgi:hypothetical protein